LTISPRIACTGYDVILVSTSVTEPLNRNWISDKQLQQQLMQVVPAALYQSLLTQVVPTVHFTNQSLLIQWFQQHILSVTADTSGSSSTLYQSLLIQWFSQHIISVTADTSGSSSTLYQSLLIQWFQQHILSVTTDKMVPTAHFISHY